MAERPKPPPPGGVREVAEPPGEVTPPQDPVEAIARETDLTEEVTGAEAEGVDPVEVLRTERDEYLEHLRRVQADFENYRKRMLREQTANLERANLALIEQLLPVLDAFDLALLNSGTDAERLRKGLELVYSELLGVLEKAGLERIDAKGKPFDPAEHEAVMQVERAEGEEAEPGVLDVVRTGYRLKGRVLRPAMVKVSS
jgi:molecular chaperone GrpE